MQRISSRERHCATPRGGVVPRVLRPVSRQKHPALTESNCPIELDKIIAILTFEIARGAGHQNGPTLSRIEIRRSGEHGHAIRRHSVPALGGQRFFLGSQRDISLDG